MKTMDLLRWDRGGLLAVVVAAALYASSLGNPFHYDDKHAVMYNPHIRSLHNIPTFFTDLQTFSSDPQGKMFRPLLLISYAGNYALHGQAPTGYRLVNVLLHAFCSWLLAVIVSRISTRVAGLAAGTIFLLHPVHAEVIHQVSGRADLLAAACVLGGVALWLSGRRTLTPVVLIGGLLCKSTAILLPAWIGARDLLRRRPQLRAYLPMVAVAAVYVGLLLANGFLASSADKAPRPLSDNLWTQIKTLPYYVHMFSMPVRLSIDHQFSVSSEPWHTPVVVAAVAALSAAYVGWRSTTHTVPVLAGAWWIVALLPTLLIPLNILVSERRSYLATAGLCVLVGWSWQHLSSPRRSWPLRSIGPVLCVVFAGLILQRAPVWGDEISLWEDAVAKGPGMYRARVNLALAYDHAGRASASARQLEAAVGIDEDAADAWVEIGNLMHRRGDHRAARSAYEKALASQPALAGVHYNLGNLAIEAGEPSMAITYYEEALRLDVDMVAVHNNLGQAFERLDRLPEALDAYRRAVAADPDMMQAWYNLGMLAASQADSGTAREALGRFLQLAARQGVPEGEVRTVDPQELEGFVQRAHEQLERITH